MAKNTPESPFLRHELDQEFDQVRNKQLRIPPTSMLDAEWFQEKPLVGIAVLGHSWQTAAKTAMWMQPERLYVLASEDVLEKPCYVAETADGPVETLSAYALVVAYSGLSYETVIREHLPTDSEEPRIYSHVEEITRRYPEARFYVDLTGGKKSSSIASTLAAFINGLPVIYIDYSDYDSERNRPVPGTEYPRLLLNPLEDLGVLEYRKIVEHFDRANYVVAQELAAELQNRLYDSRPAEFLNEFAAGYGAWEREAYPEALEKLEKAAHFLARFGGGWPWYDVATPALERHLPLLRQLSQLHKNSLRQAKEDAGLQETLYLYLIDTYHQVHRALQRHKFDIAITRAYACVERYMRIILQLEHDIDFDAPELRGLDAEDLKRFNEIGKNFLKKSYDPWKAFPDKQLYYMSGLQLLFLLSPELEPHKGLGELVGLGKLRNQIIHGFLEPQHNFETSAQKKIGALDKLLQAHPVVHNYLETYQEAYFFPQLASTEENTP